MAAAAEGALRDAGLRRQEIDGVICGYSTTLPHLMLAGSFCEFFGLQPTYCHGITAAGSTGAMMAMLADRLIRAGECKHVLIVAGENRLSASTQHREGSEKLRGYGLPDYEDPFEIGTPSYFAMFVSAYRKQYAISNRDIAEFAVLSRQYSCNNPNAHHRGALTVEDVLTAPRIADGLGALDSALPSDGGAAIVFSESRNDNTQVRLSGAGQSHFFHSALGAPSLISFGAGAAARRALKDTGITLTDIDLLAVYDRFTMTLLMLIEDLEVVPRGTAGKACRDGLFSPSGRYPLNTNGGLLSIGHAGVASGVAQMVELHEQLAGRAGHRQLEGRRNALLLAESGLLSSQVVILLQRDLS